MEYNKFLENFKKVRMEKGFSLSDFAKAIKKTKQYVYLVEKGRTPLKMEDYFLICDLLKISPNDLMEMLVEAQ